jgi:hypothetical protein
MPEYIPAKSQTVSLGNQKQNVDTAFQKSFKRVHPMHHRLKNHLLPYGKGQKYPILQKNRILHPANLTGCLKKMVSYFWRSTVA